MKTRSKWMRYFNIIMGIPNKKPRAAANNIVTPNTEGSSAEPASRHINAGRNNEVVEGWQLKSDFDRSMPLIQNCEHSY